MNSTGLVGSQPCACAGVVAAASIATAAALALAMPALRYRNPALRYRNIVSSFGCLSLVVAYPATLGGLLRSAVNADPISGQNNIISPSVMMVPTSALEKKIVRLPCDINIACRKELSAWSPSTSASTSGAKG